MLLIYTHKITKRFTYTMRQVFDTILGIEVGYTTTVEDFIKHKGPKITYTKQPLQNEFFIRSNDLLFEQGINDIEIQLSSWEGIPCFFTAGERSNIPFDIFSASFYLLSRYEEYVPHVKDDLGRFPAKMSILFKNDIIRRPLIDLWADLLLKALRLRFPDLAQKPRVYGFTPIIKVASSHCYAHRGVLRNLGGLAVDLARFRIMGIIKRAMVWFNPQKDPYNNYAALIALHQKFHIKSLFFFQFADYGRHDKNVSIHKKKFRDLIKWVGDYAQIGLSASYASAYDTSMLKKEKERLSTLMHRQMGKVRLRYNRVDLPHTYRKLIDAEFTDDYSMGYTHTIGFRAGTCTPFYFYDIALEVQQPLKVHPFLFFDYSILKMKKQSDVFFVLDDIYQEIKRLKGHFTLVFSNELLGSKHRLDWMHLYQNIVKRYYV